MVKFLKPAKGEERYPKWYPNFEEAVRSILSEIKGFRGMRRLGRRRRRLNRIN